MFEKEAEEYTVENVCSSCYFEKPCENKCEAFGCADSKTYVLKAYKDGAEYGFNKANEWHKPSEKLPEECSLVLAYSFDDTEPSLWEFVTSDQWEWMPKRIAFCTNDQIRLWQEIVFPKESE